MYPKEPFCYIWQCIKHHRNSTKHNILPRATKRRGYERIDCKYLKCNEYRKRIPRLANETTSTPHFDYGTVARAVCMSQIRSLHNHCNTLILCALCQIRIVRIRGIITHIATVLAFPQNIKIDLQFCLHQYRFPQKAFILAVYEFWW